eukprot:CAMPEP_0197435918 /NCGR_PEP_ID=MMETSP1175-20131217/3417_1 /TAXON_ID=1003142 /ORGANISM="Triceratium dubium, Strain CCMP147" /LENGTH=304 /DNA_ID=CAMNT_0042965067 /DNA_START=24 /DNA_END=934 /DNA_ORIENTATION=-
MGPTERAQCPCKKVPIRFSSFTSAEFGDLHSLSRIGPKVVDQLDAGGYTPLHLAAQNNQATATAYLLSLGADVDGRIRTDSRTVTAASQRQCGATPLHRAAYSGAVSCMRILLEWTDPNSGRRCDVLAKDTSFGDGMTPLHKAASGGRFLGVQLLLDALKKRSFLHLGLGALDVQGRTPLEVAREMVLKQEEEKSSVRRWDDVAGGPADWNRCAKILEVASSSENAIISLRSSLPRHLFGGGALACFDCATEDGRCKTASWEASFRCALASSAEATECQGESMDLKKEEELSSGKSKAHISRNS